MSEPIYQRLGTSFVWEWPDLAEPVRFTFSEVHEQSDELKAMLRVETLARYNGSYGLYHRAKINLDSTRSMAEFVTQLSKASTKNPWRQLLEKSCTRVADDFREGSPITDLSTMEPVGDIEYVFRGIIPTDETTLLSADGGTYKSWMLAALGVSFQSGIILPHFYPVSSGNVLYLDYETGKKELRRRLEMICRALRVPVPHFYYKWMERALADDSDFLSRQIDEREIKLVLVDSLAPSVQQVDDPNAAIRTMGALANLHATRIVAAHISKNSTQQTNGRVRTYGSVFFENLARSVIQMKCEQDIDNPKIGFYHTKVNQGKKAQPFAIQISIDDTLKTAAFTSTQIADSEELSQFVSQRARVHAAFQKKSQMDTSEVSEVTGIPENNLNTLLPRYDFLVKLKDGKRGPNGHPSVWGLKYNGALDFESN